MDLHQRVGQLLIFGISGKCLTNDEIESLLKWQLGGVILFSRNLISTEQAAQLTSQIKDLYSSQPLPLWFCVDQEGGVVVRLTHGVSVFPGNMALGAAKNKQFAFEQGKQTALEWGKIGVNVNLAPVLDLSYPENPGIGVRSLGQDKKEVAELGEALIQGMQQHGMCAAAKHFPGKGLARKDSHLDLPYIDVSRNALMERELYPFEKAIECDVDFVMSSHCIYKQIDPENPGTLSSEISTRLLREELGFKGLYISDDLEMGAIIKSMPIEEAALKFFQAGGDQALVCHTSEVQSKVVNRLVQAIQDGELSEKSLDEKLERINRVKKSWENRFQNLDGTNIEFSADLPYEIARNSITIIKNEQQWIPVKPKKSESVLAIYFDYSPLTQVEETAEQETPLKTFLGEAFPKIEFLAVPLESKPLENISLTEKLNKADLILLFTYNAHWYRQQSDFVKHCLNTGKKTIIIALRNPYDLLAFPQAGHFIAAYGFREASLKALVDVLTGRQKAKGVCPTQLSIEQTIS